MPFVSYVSPKGSALRISTTVAGDTEPLIAAVETDPYQVGVDSRPLMLKIPDDVRRAQRVHRLVLSVLSLRLASDRQLGFISEVDSVYRSS